MSEERPITFNLLLKDELIYEVLIRGGKPVEGVPALKAQVRALNNEMPSDEIVTCDLDLAEELKIIKAKFKGLEDIISTTSAKAGSLKSLNRLQCLAHHLFHRLGRLTSDDPDTSSQINLLTERLERLLHKIDNVMHNFKSSLIQATSLDHVGNTSAPVGEKAPCDSHAAVHKLNLKFNGKTCVRAFLQRLDELRVSRGVSELKLFNSAAELFTDEALCWYRGVRDEVSNWAELKDLLIDEYLPSDYDHRLMQEIRSRTQGVDESIINYLSVMQNYFGRLSRAITEEEKLSIVLFNIRPFYTSQLALNPAVSWADLKRKCRLLEGAKERSQHFNEPPRVTSSFLAPDLGYRNVKQQMPKVAVVRAAGGGFCVRCRVEGHCLRNCRAPPQLICFRCGEKGVTARDCKKCRVSTNNRPKNL